LLLLAKIYGTPNERPKTKDPTTKRPNTKRPSSKTSQASKRPKYKTSQALKRTNYASIGKAAHLHDSLEQEAPLLL
jgi:hypothetical protein